MTTLQNKVRLIGNVGQQPEIRTFDSGAKLARLSLATVDRRKNFTGEYVSETTWHNLVAWGRHAELIEQYVVKGKEIMIGGTLVNKSYMDKNGDKRYLSEIRISEIKLLGSNA
ncbi:MAG TPA: single-stranded DNA-binding protein [Flexilinea sp.]|nr:single-stranded DNA-binding protein [Flexilinea sp.]